MFDFPIFNNLSLIENRDNVNKSFPRNLNKSP